MDTHRFALFVRLKAKAGKEAELENFLQQGRSLAQQEPATTAWFALRMDFSTFAIFDTFPDERSRQAHLDGRLAAALVASTPHLLAEAPRIEKVDVLGGFCRSISRAESEPLTEKLRYR